ncbi:MAG TPA: hypothetical protein VGO79_11365 [Thermoanaerobaculia bacterium]
MDSPRVTRSGSCTVRLRLTAFAAGLAAAPIAALMFAALIVVPDLAALDLPNLSGKWYLNKDASDSPDAAMRDSEGSGSGGYRGSGGGGGGGMGRHGGGGGRHGGRSSAPSDDGRVSEDGSPMRDAFQRTQILDIKHEEPRLSVTDASGRERVFYTDGRKVEEEHSYGGTTKVTARWKDGHVEITSAPEKGPKVTETYAVTADHSQLTVTTTFQGGRRDVTIRRVYQTTPPAATAPGASPGQGKPAPSQPEPDPAEDAVV